VAVADEPPPPGPTGSRPTLGAVRRKSGSTTGATAEATPMPEPAATVEADEPPDTPSEPVAHPSEVSPPTAPNSPAPFPSRDQLVQAWGDHVIGRLRPKAKALFQAGRFVAADSERAHFGLPNEIHRNRCEAMRPEVEAALADQFGRPIPLVLEVDRASAPPPPTDDDPSGGSTDSAAVPAPTVAAHEEGVEDLADFDADNLEAAEIDNSAEARLLQAFPGAEEVV
jgi:DNA polymerase-3 subunit gamma/tau